jgi:magnesium transporter
MAVTIHVFDQKGYSIVDNPSELPMLIAAGARLWIDTSEGDRDLGQFLEHLLKLHPLAVEDILQDRPSPKVEDYGEYLYVVAHAPLKSGNELTTCEVDLVWNKQWIFTHRRGDVPAVIALRDELKRNPRPLEKGPAFVAHGILDNMVDAYLPIVDGWDDEIDDIETAVIENPTKDVLQHIFTLKRALQRMRRVALHQREVLHRLSRGEFDLVPEGALPFFRDIFDHFMRVADLADSYRELLSGALDAYLSTVSNRMSEVMKTLTIISSVLLPMTFIVGVYGMNFKVMPELQWRYGYLFVWILLIGVASGLILLFRRRRWI